MIDTLVLMKRMMNMKIKNGEEIRERMNPGKGIREGMKTEEVIRGKKKDEGREEEETISCFPSSTSPVLLQLFPPRFLSSFNSLRTYVRPIPHPGNHTPSNLPPPNLTISRPGNLTPLIRKNHPDRVIHDTCYLDVSNHP